MNKRVALFANGWSGENLDNYIMGLKDVFADEADIFVFTTSASFSQNQTVIDAENSILFMPDYAYFDVGIVFGSGV